MTLPASAHASAYVKDGRLCIMGIAESELGPIPFSYSTEAKGKPDGPVDFTKEDLDPEIAAAIDRPAIMNEIERGRMKVAAEQLVERARSGDQNAIVQIQAVGINARKGSDRARAAFGLLKEYMRDHPASSEPRPNVTGNTAVIRMLKSSLQDNGAIAGFLPGVTSAYVAGTLLAQGPVLSEDRINDLAARFGDDAEAFWAGWNAKAGALRRLLRDHPESKRAIMSGRATRLAWVIQGIGLGKLPLRMLCSVTAWELED